jgi:formylglycine-generating enzyme required for sulfatase activity
MVPHQVLDFTDIKDRNMDDKVDNRSIRPLRGGAFNGLPLNLRSAYRDWTATTLRGNYIGFRPARTFR